MKPSALLTAPSIVQPKRPLGPGWYEVDGVQLPLAAEGFPYVAFEHQQSGLFVISAVEVASEKVGTPALGPAYHLSISLSGQRCSSADAVWVLGQFDLVDALEDNHVPSGKVRNFWRYVADSLSGLECACTDEEPAVREDKGDYIWRPISGGSHA